MTYIPNNIIVNKNEDNWHHKLVERILEDEELVSVISFGCATHSEYDFMISLVGQTIFTDKELQVLVVSRSIEDAKSLEKSILNKFGISMDSPIKHFFLKNVTFVSYEEAMDYNPTHIFFDKATDIPDEKLFEIFNFYYNAECKFVLCGFEFNRSHRGGDKDVWKFFWNDPMNRTYVVSFKEKAKDGPKKNMATKIDNVINYALLRALIPDYLKNGPGAPPPYFRTPFWC